MKKKISVILFAALLFTLIIPSMAFAASVPVSVSVDISKCKINYVVGELLDLTGAVVTVTYHDDDTGQDSPMIEGPERLIVSPANKPIELNVNTFGLSWSDGTTTLNAAPITVVGRRDSIDSVELISAPAKTNYQEGELIDPSGIKVKAIFKSGKTEEWTSETENAYYSAEPSAALTPNDTEMAVVFRGTDVWANFYNFKFPIMVTAAIEPTPEPTEELTVAPTQEPEEEPTTAPTQSPAAENESKKKAPKTGDEEIIFPYILLATAGILAISITVKKKRAYK